MAFTRISRAEEGAYGVDDLVDFGVRVTGRDGKGQDLVHGLFRARQLRRAEMLDGWLPMARHGVVDPGRDPSRLEERRQRVPLWSSNHVQVIDVTGAWAFEGEDERKATQAAGVSRSQDPPP